MKKHMATTMFLFLVITACMGTVSAAATTDLYYTDANNHPTDHVQAGTPAASNIAVLNDANPVSNVVVEQSYQNNNQWIDDAHYYVSMDGGNTWATDPALVIPHDGGFTWEIGSLIPNQMVILRWPGIPVTAGFEIMNVQLYTEGQFVDSDTATLTITAPKNASAAAVVTSETVGMQNTGIPIVSLVLAILLLFGGLILPKRS